MRTPDCLPSCGPLGALVRLQSTTLRTAGMYLPRYMWVSVLPLSRAQPLPSAAVCTISHYGDLAEVQGPMRVLKARCITILDQCPAQVCIPDSFGEDCRRLESLTFATCNTHLSGVSPLWTVTTIQGGGSYEVASICAGPPFHRYLMSPRLGMSFCLDAVP